MSSQEPTDEKAVGEPRASDWPRSPAEARAAVADWARAAAANPLFRAGLVLAAVVAALDQASKYWIVHVVDLPRLGQIDLSPVFDLTYVENRGMSFGLFAGGLASRIALSLVVLTIAASLVVWLGRLRRPIAAAGVGVVVGGALGNLYDRVSYGYVVDFFDFSGLYFPWVFNVADAAINVGVGLLLLDALTTREDKPIEETVDAAPANRPSGAPTDSV